MTTNHNNLRKVDVMEGLILSLKDKPTTHTSEREIERELKLYRSSMQGIV